MQLYEKYKTLFNSYHVNTPLRIAHFMAQAEAESGLEPKREDVYYKSITAARAAFQTPFKGKSDIFVASYLRNSQKMANYVYANRNGNGNEASGDGFEFRGGGIFQNTFRNGYLLLAKDTRIDFYNHPELIEQEANAVIAALSYWGKNGLNILADKDDLDAISDKINIGHVTEKEGDANGFAHRKEFLKKWKKQLGI